jgi:RNA polymerase sigma-70 factor (ECF subfamily)
MDAAADRAELREQLDARVSAHAGGVPLPSDLARMIRLEYGEEIVRMYRDLGCRYCDALAWSKIALDRALDDLSRGSPRRCVRHTVFDRAVAACDEALSAGVAATYGPKVRSWVAGRLRRNRRLGDCADDIAQDVLRKVVSGPMLRRGPTDLAAYINKVITNVIIDWDKRVRNAPGSLPCDSAGEVIEGGVRQTSLTTPAPSPEEAVMTTAFLERVEHHLADLPEKHRQSFIFRHIRDMDYEQIALIMGASVPTVRVWVNRAVTKLQALLAESDATNRPAS